MLLRGLNAPALAAKAGCTKQIIYKYRDDPNKTGEALLLLRIADALEVDLRYLLTGDSPRTFAPPPFDRNGLPVSAKQQSPQGERQSELIM